MTHITLASGSEIRRRLLEQADISVKVVPAKVDEDAIRSALLAEEASARDIADTLAEMKARKVSQRDPNALVIGADQVLAFDGGLLAKPSSPEEVLEQLKSLRGVKHILYSAAVLYEDGRPVWRHVGVARMFMRQSSNSYLSQYVDRNWSSIRHSVGGYKIEEEGIRLFERIEGDIFTVQGLPLLEIVGALITRGSIAA